ncbi:unnamed protein product [Aphis gossypii]|uniref:Uncharacterized protein n=1 Tax=Aphis gossypii TaxID=80765 RepID=A0A9P0NTH2_APHGO|nr:unnamed protein product [Aphis gossypii]
MTHTSFFVSCSLKIFVQLWFDVINKFKNLINDCLFVNNYSLIHLFNFYFSIGIYSCSNILAGTHMFNFKFLELFFPFLSVFFNFILSFFFSLLQTSCFAFLSFSNFFRSPFFSSQQLLDSLGLAGHNDD